MDRFPGFSRPLSGLILLFYHLANLQFVLGNRIPADQCPDRPFGSLHTCHLQPFDHAPGQSPGAWGPWDWEPLCFLPEHASKTVFCLVSSATFNNKKGVSIIATQETISLLISAVLNQETAAHAKRHLKPSEALPYELSSLPGKNVGIIARRNIWQSESVMVSLPGIVVDNEFRAILDEEPVAQELYRRALDQLVDPDRVMGLARSMGGQPLEDVLNTNAHTGKVGGRLLTVLYPEVARLNHACNPNAIVRFSPTTLEMEVVALRDIPAGEEVVISYIEDGLPSTERKSLLSNAFGFSCLCPLCTGAADATAKSDENRVRIGEIWKTLKQNREKTDTEYELVYDLTEELLDLASAEHLGPSKMKRFHHDLMKVYYEFGDIQSAIKFAEHSLRLSEEFDGDDDIDGLQPALKRNLEVLKSYLKE